MDEKKTADVIVENEDEQDILKNFDNPEIKQSGKKGSSNKKILIIAAAAAVVFVGVILALIFIPKGGDNAETEEYKDASVKAAIDDDKTWQADVEKDKDGNIKTNGYGNLLTLVPSDIKKIELENEKGTLTITSYTPTTVSDETDPSTGEKVEKTEATQYTLVGFEDFELQGGEADTIASVCSKLSFNSVSAVNAENKLKDYGLDKPRAIARVTYNDGTKAVIKVGADAPKGLGTYVLFGNSNSTVYLCDTETVSHLLYGVNDLMSLTINESASDTETSEFSSVTLKGSGYSGDSIVIKPNTDEEIDSDYTLSTGDFEGFADNYEASLVSGGIRGLYAESVHSVNPSKSQLKSLGLSPAYAELEAIYPDTAIQLLAAKPLDDGYVLLMEKGGKVIYRISSEKVAWVNTSAEKLMSEYVLNADLKTLSSVEVDGYRFDTTTETINTADDEGEVSTTTKTTTQYNGKDIDEGNFETLFTNISLLPKRDKSAPNPGGSSALTIKFAYSTGRSDDVVKFYKNGDNNYIVTVNSDVAGTVNSTYVEKLADQAKAVAKGDSVKSFW